MNESIKVNRTRWVLRKYKETKSLPQLPTEIWRIICSNDLTMYLNVSVTCKRLYDNNHSVLSDLVCRYSNSRSYFILDIIRGISNDLLSKCFRDNPNSHYIKYLKYKHCSYRISNGKLFWPDNSDDDEYVKQGDYTTLKSIIKYLKSKNIISFIEAYDILDDADESVPCKLFTLPNIRMYKTISSYLATIQHPLDDEKSEREGTFFMALAADLCTARNIRSQQYDPNYDYDMSPWLKVVKDEMHHLFERFKSI